MSFINGIWSKERLKLPTTMNFSVTLKLPKFIQAQWHTPTIPVTREAKARG